MINSHFIKPENSQNSRTYLEGWNQAINIFHQIEREILVTQKKRLLRKSVALCK
jgi:hypothetical protein